MTYCSYCRSNNVHTLDKKYHDTQYGFPIHNDNELFKRLILEISQAGLSWLTILKKEEGYSELFFDFDIQKVADISEKYILELLQNPKIIRNRLKIEATRYNAKKVIDIQNEYGSFKNWLDIHKGLSLEEWNKLFKKTFKFTGGEIVKEFLISTGYISGAHDTDCEVGKKIKGED